MPLTNAQKQAAYAARRKIKLQRLAAYEAALREIASSDFGSVGGLIAKAIAEDALNGASGRQGEVG